MVVLGLCKAKTVSYMALACAFYGTALPESSMRRIQHFMAGFDFPMKVVSGFIFGVLPFNENLTLVMDRTNWKFGNADINILMLGVCCKNIAIPLVFKMLDKRGNSCTDERIGLVASFMERFGRERIDCLLADREFAGQKWLGFLDENRIRYHIRIRNNFKFFCFRSNDKKPVFWLFNSLRAGEFHHHPRIVKINEIMCYVSGLKTVGENGKTVFLIIVSFNKPSESLFYYQKRWQIERLFKAFKSSGFNIENTDVTEQKRLEKLFMIVMVWCYKTGDCLHKNVKQIEVKKHQRKAFGLFKYDLNYLNNMFLNPNNTLIINCLQFLSCT